jgi:uncharacterized protein
MRVAVLGASGFIGRHLVPALRARGDEVRTASLRDVAAAASAIAGCDAVVNLAGETVAQRWTAAVKQRIESSRVDAPQRLLDALAQSAQRPSAYISASATGYYGYSETATFTEESPPGNDFLAEVCVKWEREALRATETGMRVAIVRTGIALGTNGGALPKLLAPFKVGAGGRIGSGKQWMSWVHIDDVVGIYVHALDGATGIFNATAPNPVTNAAFTRAIAGELRRPAMLPVPSAAVRMILGDASDMLLLGQRVVPERTLSSGYLFRFTQLDDALRALIDSG